MTVEQAHQRQVAGAEHTNLIRRSKTFDAITDAIAKLVGRGYPKPSSKQIAAEAGLSRRSIQRYLLEQRHPVFGN